MCCRACSGYDLCQSKAELRDDCCLQCKYFDSCMDLPEDEKERTRTNSTKKRYIKK